MVGRSAHRFRTGRSPVGSARRVHPVEHQPPRDDRSLTLDGALSHLDEWLDLPLVCTIDPTGQHRTEFARMLRGAQATGNLVTDAYLGALAAEHGCRLASTDGDFSRFPGLDWFNPLASRES